MRWTPGGVSNNIEDRRGSTGGGFRMGGPLGIGGALIALVLSLLFGGNILGGGGDAGPAPDQPGTTTQTSNGAVEQSPAEAKEVQFVSFVLDDVQHTWAQVLPKYGTQYHDARLVLFRDAVNSGCGSAQAAMGPFYCPIDQKVYLDLGFYDELSQRFGAPGDFAQAYVLAHELGHHVQHLLGTDARVRELQDRRPEQANALSVRLELQADCLAGVWAHHAERSHHWLDRGDLEEALNAASQIGDDTLQRRSRGTVVPETFTHGTGAQRVGWFRRGLDSGSLQQCDTFASRDL